MAELQLQAFKCSCCGGSLEFGADKLSAKCKYCGTEHFFKEDKAEALIMLLNEACEYLKKNLFDDAIIKYSAILERYPEDSEAAWGLAVSTYGIYYTHDERTGKMVPTCSRIVKGSILDFPAYKTAVKFCADEQKPLYEARAKEIDALQKKIKIAMEKEKDFDVFISFKAKDEKGRVTLDSEIAHTIYNELTKRGIKAFFSEVTLANRIGDDYEPIIYRALYSCKFFILVATDEAYIEAPWVKNEWTRFRDRVYEENLTGACSAVFKGVPVHSFHRIFQGQGVDLEMHPYDYARMIADNLVSKFGLNKKKAPAPSPTPAPARPATSTPKPTPAPTPTPVKPAKKKNPAGKVIGIIAAILVLLTVIVLAGRGCASETGDPYDPYNPDYGGDIKDPAADENIITVRYSLVDDGTAYAVTGVDNHYQHGGDLIIPDSYEGLPVVEISDNAFYGSNFNSVQIGENVKRIGNNAFAECKSLTSVHLSPSVVNIGERAFSECDFMDLCDLSKCILLETIGNHAFSGATRLGGTLEIPPSVTYIGENAFYDCGAITSVSFPAIADGATLTIGDSAFCECDAIYSVVLPEGLTKIGSNTFSDCYSLKDLVLPPTVTEISPYAFVNCGSLETLELPYSLNMICEYAFSNCTSLKEVFLPSALLTVEQYAFDYCYSITDVYYCGESTDWDQIGISSGNDYLLNARRHFDFSDLPQTTEGVFCEYDDGRGGYVVVGYSDLADSDVVIGTYDGMEIIGISGAFTGCTDLKSITLPDSLRFIDSGAFSGCTNLERVAFGDRGIKVRHSLGSETMSDDGTTLYVTVDSFADCVSLTTFDVKDDTNSNINSHYGVIYSADGTDLVFYPPARAEKSYTLVSGVDTVGYGAFSHNVTLETFIADAEINVEPYAFYECRALKKLEFNGGITNVMEDNFSYEDYENIFEGTDIEDIKLDASALWLLIGFKDSNSFKKLEIVSGEIHENLMYQDVLSGCSNFEVVIHDSVVKRWDGSFIRGQVAVINAPGRFLTSFSDRARVKKVIFAESAENYSVPYNCFYSYGEKLEEVIFEEGCNVTEISGYAFANCTSLTEIELPDGLRVIAESVFNSSALVSVTIPKSVTTIGYTAFWDCADLTDVYFEGSEEDWKKIENNGSVSFNEVFYNYENLNFHFSYNVSCTEHVDADLSHYCDNCGASFTAECTEHIDTDGNYHVCDYCGVVFELHVDEDRDNWCDRCKSNAKLYEQSDGYVYFGEYPQSLKSNSVSITDEVDGRGYYRGSDWQWYAKVVAPDNVSGKFSTGGTIEPGEVYYFKVEPIKWRILNLDNGCAFLFADIVLDNRMFDCDDALATSGSSDYAESDISAWLNGEFAQKAFDEYGRLLIKNAVGDTVDGDKVFLLTKDDVQNTGYGFLDHSDVDARKSLQTSDYARAIGTEFYSNGQAYYWWLRGPVPSDDASGSKMYAVFEGKEPTTFFSVYTNMGIAPALYLNLFYCSHMDSDRNRLCDNCDIYYTEECYEHPDEDKDHICDYCLEQTAHNDDYYYGDGLCDICGETMQYKRSDGYIYFGEYPQTIKSAEVNITSTQDERGYYLGDDGNYYAMVVADPYTTGYYFRGDSNVTATKGETYYFKVSPIRWRILSEKDCTALVVCDSIIANGAYDDGGSNSYAESSVRAWLNETFYETAFTALQQEIIMTYFVDNGEETTGAEDNPYASEDTEDKIFLLSYEDVININYGFGYEYAYTDGGRIRYASDYAIASGICINSSEYYGAAAWWLRSPSDYSEGTARIIDYDGYGKEREYVDGSCYGIVPVLMIRLY